MRASLDSIVAATRQRLSQRASEHASTSRRKSDLQALEGAAAAHTPRGFRNQLRRVAQDGTAIAVIAELKKASPSKGLIRADFRPSELARELEQAGASCLSVLTDEQFFQGSLDYLRQIRAAARLPLLRKDFIIDERQILEAIEWGADAILLIVAILPDEQLHTFHSLAVEAGVAVLVEVHDEAELDRALKISP